MQAAALLLFGLLGGGVTEYSRGFDARRLDQATLDAESFGEKKSLKRDDDGLRITLAPGDAETGWKTPQALRIGGDFTITADLVIRKLPKPAQEDGAAVGLAIALQNIDQPDATLVRLIEPGGADVYRPVDRTANNPMQMQMQMQQQMQLQMQMQMQGGVPQAGAKPPRPPRQTFPASGGTVALVLQREGSTLRFQVIEGKTDRPRYLGQAALGANDVAAVKLFASNRNGAEAVDVVLRGLTIRADRISGLGTVVRTVYGQVIYADPTAIENGVLVLGGPTRTPAGAGPNAGAPRAAAPGAGVTPAPTAPAIPAAALVPAAAVAVPGPAVAIAPATIMRGPNGLVAVAVAVGGSSVAPMAPATPAPPGTSSPPARASVPAAPKPKVRVALDEVESIVFERTPALAGRFLGQPNIDLTMPRPAEKKDNPASKPDAKKAAPVDDPLAPPPGTVAATVARVPRLEPKKNGIRDLHLWLSNLRPAAVRQVTVTCQTDKGPTGWRLDTSNSQDWPLVIRRAGTEPWADLFLEPPPGDCFQKDFMVNVSYADGQNANTTIKAGEHTDLTRAVDPKAAASLLDARVYLAGDQTLFGKLESVGEESLRLTTPWQDRLDVPLARVAGVHLGLPGRKETPESFARRLQTRGTEDMLLAQTKDGEVVVIPGVLEGTEGDRLRFRYKEKRRTLPLSQVEGLVLAARPESRKPEDRLPTFSLPGGLSVSGRWKDLSASAWKVETAWGQTLSLPAAEVLGVRFAGGQMTYLSDLKPSKVEETPFFGRRLPWRRDVNLAGEPIKVDGRIYERGLAVHSRCILTYDLDRRYATFETVVGFDDAAMRKGRVDCRVLADGKELYANPDLRADGPPVKLTLSVAGAEQLQLHVDFGRDQDTGDRVVWAGARLYRRPPPGAPAATPSPR